MSQKSKTVKKYIKEERGGKRFKRLVKVNF